MSFNQEQAEAECPEVSEVILSMNSLRIMLRVAGESARLDDVKAALQRTAKLAETMQPLIQRMVVDKQTIIRDQEALAADQAKVVREKSKVESLWTDPRCNKILGQVRELADLTEKHLPHMDSRQSKANKALTRITDQVGSLAASQLTGMTEVKTATESISTTLDALKKSVNDGIASEMPNLAKSRSIDEIKAAVNDGLAKLDGAIKQAAAAIAGQIPGLAKSKPVDEIRVMAGGIREVLDIFRQTLHNGVISQIPSLAKSHSVVEVRDATKKMSSTLDRLSKTVNDSIVAEMSSLAKGHHVDEVTAVAESVSSTLGALAETVNVAIVSQMPALARDQSVVELGAAMDDLAAETKKLARDQSLAEMRAGLQGLAEELGSLARDESVSDIRAAIDGWPRQLANVAASVAQKESLDEAKSAIADLGAVMANLPQRAALTGIRVAIDNAAKDIKDLTAATGKSVNEVTEKMDGLASSTCLSEAKMAIDSVATKVDTLAPMSELRTCIQQQSKATLDAIDKLSACIAECASDEGPNPIVATLQEIQQAMPTETQLGQLGELLCGEFRAASAASSGSLTRSQCEQMLQDRAQDIGKSLAANLRQLQTTLVQVNQETGNGIVAAQKEPLGCVLSASRDSLEALDGIHGDIVELGMVMQDASLAAADAAKRTAEDQSNAITDAVGQIKSHLDQVRAAENDGRVVALEQRLSAARRTITAREDQVSEKRGRIARLEATNKAQEAEIERLRLALGRANEAVSLLANKVDGLTDSFHNVQAGASSDRGRIDSLTTEVVQLRDDSAKKALALDAATASEAHLRRENDRLGKELAAASEREAAARREANEVATGFVDLEQALADALSDQVKSVQEKTTLAAKLAQLHSELAQCRQERDAAIKTGRAAEPSGRDMCDALQASIQQVVDIGKGLADSKAAQDAAVNRAVQAEQSLRASLKDLEESRIARDEALGRAAKAEQAVQDAAGQAEGLRASVDSLTASLQTSEERTKELEAASSRAQTVDSLAAAVRDMVDASVRAELDRRDEEVDEDETVSSNSSPPRKRRRVEQGSDDNAEARAVANNDCIASVFAKLFNATRNMPVIPTHPSHTDGGFEEFVVKIASHLLRHDNTLKGLAALCQRGPLDRWFCLSEVASYGEHSQRTADLTRFKPCSIHPPRSGCLFVQVALFNGERVMRYSLVS